MTEVDSRVETHIREAMAGLKDFQKATVEVVHRRLFQEGQKNMLIADEVGLGKTIVAKGVIAKELLARREAGIEGPFKVTYICSNQVIAGENIRKLNPFPEQAVVEREARRIAFLAYQPAKKDDPYSQALTLNTLTPGTSFQVSNSLGTQYERSILYALLCHDESFLDRKTGLACMVRGGVRRKASEWEERLEWRSSWPLRTDLPERFWGLAAERPLSKSCPKSYELLGYTSESSLLEAAYDLAGLLSPENEKQHRSACNELVSVLRRVLIDACLSYVDADLFILDEFQRFRSLIDCKSEAEEAQIARRVFGENHARVLLLSATPFKAFTGDLDHANGEDHFKDFRTVLHFLTGEDDRLLDDYDTHRRALYRQLLSLAKGAPAVSTEHREAIEAILRRVMCRTERHSVSTDPNAMIVDRWKTEYLPFSTADVANFTAADYLAQVLARAYEKGRHAIGPPVEYCKSAPFPFSFLDGYVLKKVLEQVKNRPEVRKALESQREAWLDTSKIEPYQLVIGGPNIGSTDACTHARLSQLIDAAVGPHGAGLLWIPPSLPYYPLEGAFQNADGFSKTLVFSAWVMVPRMIASLVSYEVERRTVGNPATRDRQESEPRTYFTVEKKRRHPAPLFTFPSGRQERQIQRMTNFCLLYPSPILAAMVTTSELMASNVGLDALRADLVCRFREAIHQTNLQRYENPNGTEERWYWAAPLLLDRERSETRSILDTWFSDQGAESAKTFFEGKDGGERGRAEHFQTLLHAFHSPVEKECLHLLLSGQAGIILCPAREIEHLRLRSEWKPALDAGRMLILSPFKNRQPDAATCDRRNRLVADLADNLYIPYAGTSGLLADLSAHIQPTRNRHA